MKSFPDWKKYAATQKDNKTGCIPTIYETMLNAAGATGIDYTIFQDEFDLQRRGIEGNHFVSIAEAIKKKYPAVEFVCENFPTGTEKLKRLEELLDAGKLVAISVALEPTINKKGYWHIMPVIEWNDDNIVSLRYMPSDGQAQPDKWTITKKELVDWHDNYEGGSELAYLKGWK